MFLIHRTSNDKTLSVPVAQQLYGLLAYATSQGEFLFEPAPILEYSLREKLHPATSVVFHPTLS